jgi:hypothetical protein
VKVTDSEELTVGGQGDTFPNQETAICIWKTSLTSGNTHTKKL